MRVELNFKFSTKRYCSLCSIKNTSHVRDPVATFKVSYIVFVENKINDLNT